MKLEPGELVSMRTCDATRVNSGAALVLQVTDAGTLSNTRGHVIEFMWIWSEHSFISAGRVFTFFQNNMENLWHIEKISSCASR